MSKIKISDSAKLVIFCLADQHSGGLSIDQRCFFPLPQMHDHDQVRIYCTPFPLVSYSQHLDYTPLIFD